MKNSFIYTAFLFLTCLIALSNANDTAKLGNKECHSRPFNYQHCFCRDGRDGRDGKDGLDGRDGVDGCDGKTGREGKPGRYGVAGKDGKGGVSGTNGTNGRDGKDGSNGRDGVDGRNGTNGKDGKDGSNGRDGVDGIRGANGTNGRDGKDGSNGLDGVDGRNGNSAQQRNWKECAWKNMQFGIAQGVTFKCNFKKKSTSTHLKVVVSVNTKVDFCDKCCKRWFVTFNGKECTPVPIDIAVYLDKYTDHQMYRPRILTGHCSIQTQGSVEVALNHGKCPNYRDGSAYTGWNSSTRIYIEEIEAPQA